EPGLAMGRCRAVRRKLCVSGQPGPMALHRHHAGGEAVIRVVDARISKELEYMQSVTVSNFPWEPEGGYTMLASASDTRGVGIYFRAGRRGFMMPVGGDIPCAKIEAADVDAFIELGRVRFGMDLAGGT